MLLVNAYDSRFYLPFLEHINTPATEWYVCISVPYGTSLWKVGDSAEKNDSYKMAPAKFKWELLNIKIERVTSPNIFPL